MPQTVVNRQERLIEEEQVETGGLVVYFAAYYLGKTVTIRRRDDDSLIQTFQSTVCKHSAGRGVKYYAALFPALSPDDYVVFRPGREHSAQSWDQREVHVLAGAKKAVSFC